MDLSIKQIRLLHAISVTKSKAGAANLLCVSQAAVGARIAELEKILGFPIFSKSSHTHVPTPQALALAKSLASVLSAKARLEEKIELVKRGEDIRLNVASVPSIAHRMAPVSLASVRTHFSKLQIEFDILKIDAVDDYLTMPRGEAVALSYSFEHALLSFRKLERGALVCIVPSGHPWATRKRRLHASELEGQSLIGVGTDDRYGQILARPLTDIGKAYKPDIRVRFGASMISLVQQGVGIAIVDCFTAADLPAGVSLVRFAEPVEFETFVAHLRATTLSPPCQMWIEGLRSVMRSARRVAD